MKSNPPVVSSGIRRPSPKRSLTEVTAPASLKSNLLMDFGRSEIASDTLRELAPQLDKLRLEPSASSLEIGSQGSLEERLFDATASAKILTSRIAMHIDSAWRDKLFRQLDSLHDLDEWDANDAPMKASSFYTFLRTMFRLKPQRKPGLGLSPKGNLVASWEKDGDYLTVEFLPSEQTLWVISRLNDDETERIAGQTAARYLASTLATFQLDRWLSA